MKKPLHLLACLTAGLALIAGVLFYLRSGGESEGEEGEKEGIPGVLRSMEMWSDARTYPHKSMDQIAYVKSFDQAREMTIEARNRSSRTYSTTTAPWTALGPKNFSGRVISMGFHPTNPNIMWVGSAAGGLWRTTTGGTGAAGGINWTYISTGKSVLGVMSIAVHPTDGNTVYIGTGEVYDNGSIGVGQTGGGHIRTFRGSYGIGILKTTDNGLSWERMLSFDSSQLKGVADILIHPTTPTTVFAATTDGVYRTTNGGTNWDLIHNVEMAMDICFKPGDPSVLYVACGNFNTTGRGIYKTINSTAATPTFTPINSGLPATISGKIALAMSAANPNYIMASIGRSPYNAGDPFAIYHSSNEGASWTQRITASGIVSTTSALNQGWYAHDIAISPVSTDTVYWAEMDIWRSDNNGAGFTRKTFWNQWNINYTTVGGTQEGTSALTYAHADIHRIYISPFNPRTIFVCTDGGIFRSTNNGNTFIGLNGGLMTAQIYPNMGQSMQNDNLMIGGLQDNEGFIYEGNPGCRRIGNLGDGFHAVIHPTNSNIRMIASYYLNIRRTIDGGTNWSTVISNSGIPPSENACFNAPFVMAPSNSTIMYAGTYRLRKSTNTGANWSTIGPNPLVNTSALILYIAVAPSNADILYVSVAPGGGSRSRLFKSINGGSNFTEITGTLPDRYYTDIAVDAANPNRVAVTVSGFGSSHVYMTRDAGTTWTDIGGNLPDIPHNTLMFDPNNRRSLYVGNDLGVFYAHGLPVGTGASPANTPVTWTAYNEGIEDAVLVSDLLTTASGKLRMATFGRGLWERDLAPSSILPFVFKKFTVTVTDEGNKLNWTISSQNEVDRYEVEYSNDATNFRKVGVVTATGSGDVAYNFLHPIKNDMDGFYRIKIISIDGSYEYSIIQSVKAQKPITKLTVTPNPTTGIFKIKIPAESRGALNMQLYDNGGKLVMVKRLEVQPWTQDVPVDISRFAAGTYQIVCEGYQAKWTTRIIKK